MALYVSICLLAALMVTSPNDGHASNSYEVLRLIWGTTLGLSLAHWIAFSAANRLVNRGRYSTEGAQLAAAQLAGAGLIAILSTVVVLAVPLPDERNAALALLTGLVAVIGALVAKRAGASCVIYLCFGLGLAAIATAAALIKNALAGH